MALFDDEEKLEERNLITAFVSIYGIGKKEAFNICKKLGFNYTTRFKDLNLAQKTDILNYIDYNYKNGFHLERFLKDRIDSLIRKKTYKGIRHSVGLRVRGQRSKNKRPRRIRK